MKLIAALLICGCLRWASGADCRDISGAWRDDLGSNMTIQMIPNSNRFTGKFSSGVDSSPGAQDMASQVDGLIVPVQGGSLIAFTVLFNGGQNIASWAGQCMVCAGEAKLLTTFVLRFGDVPTWRSSIVNRNNFCKPKDAQQVIEMLNAMPINDGVNVKEKDLLGLYSASEGDSLEINNGNKSGTFEGVYFPRPASHGFPIYGFADGPSYIGAGFVSEAGSRSHKKIQAFAGHIQDLQNPVLETAFLQHTFTDSCEDPTKNARIGFHAYKLT